MKIKLVLILQYCIMFYMEAELLDPQGGEIYPQLEMILIRI